MSPEVYSRRSLDDELDELLPLASAIALEGPKGVGKTRTALRRSDAAWFLDDESHRALVSADPTFAAAPPGTLLIDEWQRLPSVWDSVRRRVDEGAPAGRFLLSGSATPVGGTVVHSGAGRILSLRMRPMALYERPGASPSIRLRHLLDGRQGPIGGMTSTSLVDYFEAIESTGLPGLMREPPRLRRPLLRSYVDQILLKDLPEQGLAVRRPETLRRWLAAYAAASSTTAAYSRILDSATAGDGSQPAKTTTIAYRDHLTQLFLLDPVPGWSPSRSPLRRLQQAPKHQLADPGLAAAILGFTAQRLLSPQGAHVAGPLFEALATLSVRVAAQSAEARVGHLRTGNGDREVDLIVEGESGQVLGIEVKMSASVGDADVRHLRWLREHLGSDVVDLVVLTTGTHAYRRPDGIAVIPLALLGA